MKKKINIIFIAILWACLIIIFPVISGVISSIMKLNVITTLFLQAGFMVLSLLPPFILVFTKKWQWQDLGFNQFNKHNIKRCFYFIPVLIIFIPVVIGGFYFKSFPYVMGNLFLYLSVGIAEEIYFRGIIPKQLNKQFSTVGVILLSTLIFGLGHSVIAFTSSNVIEVILTIINAIIFGFLAIEIKMLAGNIIIPIIIHFLFDFSTKIIPFNGTALLIIELIRGTLMVIVVIWLTLMIKKIKQEPVILNVEQKQKRKKQWIITLSIFSGLIIIVGIAITGLSLYGKSQMQKIPKLSFNECLTYTLENNDKGIITVGIIENNEMSYKVYGKDGKEISKQLYTYEIGSITKTLTASLIQIAIRDGKINLLDTIDKYLDLPNTNRYPTILELVTHTSGYKNFYFELPMITNFLNNRNDYYQITDKMVFDKLKLLDTPKKNHQFVYSNYGYAVLGSILEAVYQKEYTILVNDFTASIALNETHINDYTGNLDNYWKWQANDAYLAAGGLTSNIIDMLQYAKYQLDENNIFKDNSIKLKEIKASTSENKMMDINMDAIGMGWIIDNKNNIIWHNGATTDFNAYLGFNQEKKVAVVILSNLSPNYRIPTTVMGVKLLKELMNK